MRLGNITETVWRKAIGRQLKNEEKGMFPPSWQERCGGICTNGEQASLWAEAVVSAGTGRAAYYAVRQAAGDLAARGVRASGVSVRLLLPQAAEEANVAELAAGAKEACDELGISLSCIRGEVTPAVSLETATAAVVGDAPGKRLADCRGAKPGDEILLCGYVGLEGSLRILDEAGEELERRFSPAFLEQARQMKQKMICPGQFLELWGENAPDGLVSAAHQIGSGGIFAALWELSGASGVGFEAALSGMAVRQETVEICEYFQLNPYLMTSAGSFLLATADAGRAIEVLEKAGASAGRLGVIKAQNARVITSGNETRYLDRPAPDELMRWQAMRKK